MKQLENYIYYSICEKSFELFLSNPFFSTDYTAYCISLKTAMQLENLSSREINIIYALRSNINLLYNIGDLADEYIIDFFLLEKYLIFEESVRLILQTFPNSFN